jgi:hypothetical protein
MLRWADAIAAQREYAAAQPAPGSDRSARARASRAAVAANEAYKAGDLDRAWQLTDQAAALDPSRAELWQQHRTEIAARRLILSARSAQTEGDHQRAGELLQGARQLDPRMRTLWDGSLSAQPPDRPARQAHARDTAAPGPGSAAGSGRSPATEAGHYDHAPAALAHAGQKAPSPSWPGPPARREPRHPAPAAPRRADRTHPLAQRPAAEAPHEPRAHPGAGGHEADASAEPDGDPAARWPAPNPRVGHQAGPPGQQARHEVAAPGQQPGRGKQITPAPETEPSRTTDTGSPAAPSADWRDDVLSQARQPWQPAPSWPGNPALHRPPEPGTPGAGIEPSEPQATIE